MIRHVFLVALSILALCFGVVEARLGVFAPRLLKAIDWAVSEQSSSANKVMASTPSGLSGTSTDSRLAAAVVLDVDAASSPPTPGEGIVSMWLAKVAASGMQHAAKNSVVSNVGANVEHMAMAPQPSPPQDIWSIVCSTCSKAQVESCFLRTALDAPSRTYNPNAAVFHSADTYDCLVNTDGCCAVNNADDDGSHETNK
jgi:hypothetical protein